MPEELGRALAMQPFRKRTGADLPTLLRAARKAHRAMNQPGSSEQARPRASRPDPHQLGTDFQRWLRTRQPDATITEATMPSSNGMSSETLIVGAHWGARQHRLVVRVAPQPQTSPVFPHYDMRGQYRVLQRLGAQINRPAVPQVLWCEDDPGPLGAPFFVMHHIDGQIPPDVMPYNFGSWLTEAGPEHRQRLQRTTLDHLARVHAAPWTDFAFLDQRRPAETALAAHVRRTRDYYEWTKADGLGVQLIERGFDWLTEHWPASPPSTDQPVLSWGDARIGNIIYRDFSPAGLLDWEMAALGPRELDLGWMVFFHRFFEDLAYTAGLPGLPDLLRRHDVTEGYTAITGYRPTDLDFYITYAALQHAIILVRVQLRAIAFGQATPPTDRNEMIMHRHTLASMLDGTYWPSLKGSAPT
jgi:aminoglycoside phosphotransferase (APT) family kinase protein